MIPASEKKETRGRPAKSEQCRFCKKKQPSLAFLRYIHIPDCAKNPARGTGGGAPKDLRECQYCGSPFGVMAMRVHMPLCQENPKHKGTAKKIPNNKGRKK